MYISTRNTEKAFMKQKTKNKWLNLGNQGAAYFHKVVKKGNAKNFIKFCMIQMGIKWRTRINLKLQLWSFISTCWVCQRSGITEKHINRINQVLRDQISDAQKEILQNDMTELEIQ